MAEDTADDDTSTHTKKKTRSVTFRLDASVIDELQTEADTREISLNVLVNQVLKRFAEWDRFESKIGMMPVPKIMLSTLIDKSISVARDSGIKDVERYRDDIIKQGRQTEGIPNQEANPTPQAPISDINIQQENQTTAAEILLLA
jgi:hypothetical protein